MDCHTLPPIVSFPRKSCLEACSLLNLVYWHLDAYQVTWADRATQVTSPAFDATGWELWPYLAIGAQVHIVDDETCLSPELLRDWLVQHRITVSFQSTAVAESLLALEWPDRSHGRRHVWPRSATGPRRNAGYAALNWPPHLEHADLHPR